MRMSGSWPSRYLATASSAAVWACGSIVVVTCRPSVFNVCSSMLNRSINSLVTCRSIKPLGPVVWFCVRARSADTVGGNTCAARSLGDRAPIVTMPSSTQFHRSAAPSGSTAGSSADGCCINAASSAPSATSSCSTGLPK